MSKLVLQCPACWRELVERIGEKNGSRFLACSARPGCDHTEAIPAWLEMVRAGAAQLPGLEDQ